MSAVYSGYSDKLEMKIYKCSMGASIKTLLSVGHFKEKVIFFH